MDATGERVPMEPLDVSRTDSAALRAHVTAAAQDALADAALQQLSSVPPDATAASLATARAASFGQVSEIVSQLANEAFASLPENHPAHAQQRQFSQEILSETFSTATSLQACVAAVAGLLDHTVQLLLQVPLIPKNSLCLVYLLHRLTHRI
jgi:aminopeptidase N